MMNNVLKFGSGNVSLDPLPIRPEWILEGSPVARARVLSSSRDGASTSMIWDCTAGRFNWFYNVDETVYVIEGSVLVKERNGVQRRISAGETIYFPAGAEVEWVVEKYIRKVAFLVTPLPTPLRIAKRYLGWVKRMMKGKGSSPAPAAMFQ